MNADQILEDIAKEKRQPSKFELGALRAALPSADPDTAEAIHALVDPDASDKFSAGQRRGLAGSSEYPILSTQKEASE